MTKREAESLLNAIQDKHMKREDQREIGYACTVGELSAYLSSYMSGFDNDIILNQINKSANGE